MTTSAMEFMSETQIRLRVRESVSDGKSLPARRSIYLMVENDSPIPLTVKDARRLARVLEEMADMADATAKASKDPCAPKSCAHANCNRLALLGSGGCEDHADVKNQAEFREKLRRISSRGQ